MSDHSRDTIFALSSGRGPAAIAVVRISGPRAGDALKALGCKIPEPRKAGLARIRDTASGDVIDEGLALWFPGPRSETGEDIVELQLHGGRAVIAATLAALSRVEGLRPAEAGEFTRRAFENGKLDLTAVEGLADLVNAETEGQRRQAFRQMKGALGARTEGWREKLIAARALIEARIDFSDEADVPEDLVAPALAIARTLEAEIAAALVDGHRGERLREGLVVAIAGPPNAGKSTLLNRIARREAAIVSPYAGTTRDVIEVHLDLEGLPVTLLDTAGIRETEDPIELEGVRRAQARAAAADLVLWVVDASESAAGSSSMSVAAGEGSPEEGGPGKPTTSANGPARWLVRNKVDLVTQYEYGFIRSTKNEREYLTNNLLKNKVNFSLPGKNESQFQRSDLVFSISATDGTGVDNLLKRLAEFADEFMVGAEATLITRERHRHALGETLAALQRCLDPKLAGREDLLAEELRAAAHALGRLTGRVDVEDVLDVIFRDFCIGK